MCTLGPATRHGATIRARAGCDGAQDITLSGPGPVPVSDGRGDYADDTECTWHIQAEGPITVVFKAFATEPGYDFVTLDDGTGGEVRYSGFVVPPPFSTNSTSLTILFTSDGSSGSGGFELEVFALVPSGTWAPTAVPTNAPTVTTLAPDIPGTPSTHTRKDTILVTRAPCTSTHARARVCKTRWTMWIDSRGDVIAWLNKEKHRLL